MESSNEPVALRMRLGFDSLEAFEQGYARFVTDKGIFLASRTPREPGTLLRFELQTRTGDSILMAEGRVVATRDADSGAPHRVPGMHVRFTRLTQESRERIARMTGAAVPGTDRDQVAVEPDVAAIGELRTSSPTPMGDPDAVSAPTPAPIEPGGAAALGLGKAEGPPPGTDPPMDLPDPARSPFRDIFTRLFGMGGGAPPTDDPFDKAVQADLPTVDGLPLEEIPELPADPFLT